MYRLPRRLFAISIATIALTLIPLASAAETARPAPAAAATAANRPQFLIVMRLTPKYHQADAWTDEANAIVGAHFTRLKEASDRGDVILAGRTLESHDKTMGLVVLTADDQAAAEKFMLGDPCVAAGIMSATLHPYAVAILRK